MTSLLALTLAAATLTTPAQAVSGTTVTDTSYTFTAKLAIGNSETTMRACSGALVNARWVLTASSCFTRGLTELTAGKPAEKTIVTVGRSDLTDVGDPFAPNGLVTTVTELVPYQGRDLVLARLEQPASGITPVSLAATPAAAGETLKVAGFGRTKTEWVPFTLHTGSFTVDAVQDGTVAITGQGGAAVCAGDTGGPLLREKDGKLELVGINSRSWQAGCLGADLNETRTSALSVDVADPAALTWLKTERDIVHMADVNGDGLDDMIVQSRNGSVSVRVAYKGPVALKPGQPYYRFNEAVHWSSGWGRFFTGTDLGRLYFADMNADNKADMIVHTTDGNIAVRLNIGTGFNAGSDWSGGWGRFVTGTDLGRLYFADMNADNKADMIVHTTDGNIAVRTNLGSSFNGGTNWSGGWGRFVTGTDLGRLYFADMNADNKADMIVHTTDGNIAVRTNLGSSFNGGTNWSGGWGRFVTGTDLGRLYFADAVDGSGNGGDRKADMIVHTKDGRIALRQNTGSAFVIVNGDDWA
ncbi:trypsin-like serine protease [Streptomyces sp. TLI_105]|uniref:S1 family peptidase n=1 Tax=Streptomyces sp. TLI_105 TaxID=1881019 RepID=UPI00089A4426|nr:S1 family peptidase [Streptomyces sp. TLI_105]SEB57777.1 Trypsin [Streptomyces sp. TLI_105]